MNDYKVVPVENGKPDARRKGVRVEVLEAVIDDNDYVIGFLLRYSALHQYGISWVRLGDPFLSNKEVEHDR